MAQKTEINFNKFPKQQYVVGMDFDDPFAPDLRSNTEVRCLHCGDRYLERNIMWDNNDRIWRCPNFFNEGVRCEGVGFHYDIIPVIGRVIF